MDNPPMNEDPKNWTTDELVAFLEKSALAYRQGQPQIDDDTYDHVYLAELWKRDPEHPFLHEVEVEPDYGAGRLKHPEPMLSTEKSYSIEETRKWVKRIRSEANKQEIEASAIGVIVTAKLDGLAAMLREDGRLVTRGDGAYGNDITSAFTKGVVDVGQGMPGVGELVMVESYFEEHLKAAGYAHPRNVCVGIVNSDEINDDFKQALKAGMVRYVPYATLERWRGSVDELLDDHNAIEQYIRASCEYPIDGVVAEITHEKLKNTLGSTSHHNRWQIAIKQRAVAKQTRVKSISWQTGRTGRVTPVLGVEPIELSGAIVSRITAHHAGNVKALGLGEGAVISAERSGEVIPKIVEVIEPAKETILPAKCPSCEHTLVWEGDFLTCANHLQCPAQIKNTLEHFFRTHGQVDGFGPRSIDKLVDAGIDTLERIYASTEEDFIKAGFGNGQSRNLRRELNRSLSVQIEDWRFLAAFGVARLGKGDSRRLLQQIRLEQLASVSEDEIIRIDGFAELSAGIIVVELKEMWPTIKRILDLGFNLEETLLLSESREVQSSIAGMKIVFTGKMMQASRDDMKKQAMHLGAMVQSAVSSKTDLLICGASVGAAKMSKAEQSGVRVLTEEEYAALLNAVVVEK